MSNDEIVSETYAGPMPPEISPKTRRILRDNITEVASHIGWSDEAVEKELMAVLDYVQTTCRVVDGDLGE